MSDREKAALIIGLVFMALGLCAVPLAVLVLMLMLSPGSRSGDASGKVTYAGQIVPVGFLSFHSEKWKVVIVEIENGKYKAERVPPGPCTVTVSTAAHRRTWRILKEQRDSSGGRLPPDLEVMAEKWETARSRMWGMEGLPVFVASTAASTAGLLGSSFGQGSLLAVSVFIPGRTGTEEEWDRVKDLIDVPEKYMDPGMSGLKYEIKPGKQEINIDMPKVASKKEKDVKDKGKGP